MSVIQSNASCFYDKVIHEKFSRLLTINYSEISNLTNFFWEYWYYNCMGSLI